MFFGFVIFTLTAMMMTSQMPLAYAGDRLCINEIITGGTITDNIIVPKASDFPALTADGIDGIPGNNDDGTNTCVLDGVDHKGNIFVKEESTIFLINGVTQFGDIKLEEENAAIHFEGINQNTKKGNIQASHEKSFVYIENLTLDGNINGKGEVYINSHGSSSSVFLDSNIILDGDGTTEFVMDGGTVTGNIRVFGQLEVDIDSVVIGGNLEIKDTEDKTGLGIGSDISIENNDIDGNMILQKNKPTIILNNNDVGGNANCKDNDSVTGDPDTNFVEGKAQKDCKPLFKADEANFPPGPN